MKKLILLLSVLSIFLIPSFSFADKSGSNVLSYYDASTKYSFYTNGSFYATSDGDILSTSITYRYTNESINYDTIFSGSRLFRKNVLINNELYNYRVSTNSDIYSDSSLSDVFFSRPPVPLILAAEELPPVVAQHGGTVLSVVLKGFGVLLVVSLIPRLVKQFLY